MIMIIWPNIHKVLTSSLSFQQPFFFSCFYYKTVSCISFMSEPLLLLLIFTFLLWFSKISYKMCFLFSIWFFLESLQTIRKCAIAQCSVVRVLREKAHIFVKCRFLWEPPYDQNCQMITIFNMGNSLLVFWSIYSHWKMRFSTRDCF